MTILPISVSARPKAPFSVCVIQSRIPTDKKEQKREKNIQKHLKSRFEGEISAGVSPEACSADLYLLRVSQDKEERGVFGQFLWDGFKKPPTAHVELRIVGFAPGQAEEEPAVDQMFAGKQAWITTGLSTNNGSAEKDAVKKIHKWADENREAIAEALQIEWV